MDIEGMKQAGDVRGLIRHLDHDNDDLQWSAADALGSLGEIAVEPLLKILSYHKMHVRIGVIEALSEIKSTRSVDPLIQTLMTDEDHEVRWVAALALGEIGDNRALPSLVFSLRDKDRYVRYGSAKALEKMGWSSATDQEKAYYLIGLQDWKALRIMGSPAAGPLIETLQEQNPSTRAKIVELLGEMRTDDAKKACETALGDADPSVRWAAIIASKKCGITTTRLPLVVSRRSWTTPSPIGIAILNFFFCGIGYHFLQKWYGYLLFMCYMTTMVFIQLFTGAWFPFIYAYPFTLIVAVHSYYMVKHMHDL
ncbi:MAG: HEAT repeat domain-containing protein [Methanoregula sp.]|nr:HEAT repeat domain-containing protein [Methanoregula sp.]